VAGAARQQPAGRRERGSDMIRSSHHAETAKVD
jgi:hypothetical protein